MITRQRTLLRLLQMEKGKVSKLRLFKLAFLFAKEESETPSSALYEFLPYQFGPYSFTLNHDLRSLEREGWLRVLGTEICAVRALDAETAKLDGRLARSIANIVTRYESASTDDLIADVYRRFPWYTAAARNQKRRRATIPTADCAVYGVGYEGMMLDGLLDLLLQAGIKQLIDVRCNPVARRFGFHRSTLERHCKDVGLSYVHLPELGIPSGWRQELDDMEAYERLFMRYEGEILPSNEAHVEIACRLVTASPSAFMCLEADAKCCHRTRLARVVADRTGLPMRELRCQ
jgi:uncharacterized protein (DUF488 family)